MTRGYPAAAGRHTDMADITIFPHGDRWAVAERGAESPSKEFPSRDLPTSRGTSA
jgi:hypothetical protein